MSHYPLIVSTGGYSDARIVATGFKNHWWERDEIQVLDFESQN